MSTPKFDALVAKTRDWSARAEAATISTSIISDCLKYSADEAYRVLRIPALEATVTYTVVQADNEHDGGDAYTSFAAPSDLTQFIYVRTVSTTSSHSDVFNEVVDSRTFFDTHSEKHSPYHWMWKEEALFIRPQLDVGDTIEIGYYHRLPDLNAQYSVIPINYTVELTDGEQPYLTLTDVITDTPLYFALGVPYATNAEALANGVVTTKYYIGKEVSNWLRDQNERLLIWGALKHLGAYLFDEKMELRYEKKVMEDLTSMNKEEKWRRASGGNIRVNANGFGLI